MSKPTKKFLEINSEPSDDSGDDVLETPQKVALTRTGRVRKPMAKDSPEYQKRLENLQAAHAKKREQKEQRLKADEEFRAEQERKAQIEREALAKLEEQRRILYEKEIQREAKRQATLLAKKARKTEKAEVAAKRVVTVVDDEIDRQKEEIKRVSQPTTARNTPSQPINQRVSTPQIPVSHPPPQPVVRPSGRALLRSLGF